jgi:Tol biopolymer transport system component
MKYRTRISSVIIIWILLLVTNGCKKPDDKTGEEDYFKVITLPSLRDPIPYQSLGEGKIVFERINDADGESGFYVIDIDRKKADGFRLNSLTRWPAISPDGTKIACSLLTPYWKSTWNIYIMSINGSNCYPVFLTDEWETCPSWTPDGSRILCYSPPVGPLFIQSAIENAKDRVEMTKCQYDDDPGYMISPDGAFSISPDGNIVCTSRGSQTSGILNIIPFIGKEGVKVLVPLPLPDDQSETRFESPSFSPDGLKIAFAAIITETSGNRTVSINCINIDGSDLTELIGVKIYFPKISWRGYNREVSLCWSPDGKKILFTALTDPDSGYHLFVINADGSGYTQVTDNINAYDFDVSWSK